MSRSTRNSSDDLEGPPEADRLGGFCHPREIPKVWGHDDAEAIFLTALKANRIHHAWLFQGPEGVGKATFAYRVARYLLARADERDFGLLGATDLSLMQNCRTLQQVAALSHPGLFIIRRPWHSQRKRFLNTIPVDEVRKLRTFLTLSADMGAWRVVIVDRADELNVNAANALLKSLEEPPERCLFLLISSQPAKLLATIRSRSRRLDFGPLAGEHLRSAAAAALELSEKTPVGESDWSSLERLSGGSVRRALVLIEGDGLTLYYQVLDILKDLPKFDRKGVIALAERLSGHNMEAQYEMFFDVLLDLIGRLVGHSVRDQVCSKMEVELATRLVPRDRVVKWATLWEITHREKSNAEFLNLDRRTLVLETLLRLESISRDAA